LFLSSQASTAVQRPVAVPLAHHSTALEGNTLVLREVEVLLDKGRAVGAKPLREYMEVQRYGNAARWVYAHAIDPGTGVLKDLSRCTRSARSIRSQ
jgi:Fic family protein